MGAGNLSVSSVFFLYGESKQFWFVRTAAVCNLILSVDDISHLLLPS